MVPFAPQAYQGYSPMHQQAPGRMGQHMPYHQMDMGAHQYSHMQQGLPAQSQAHPGQPLQAVPTHPNQPIPPPQHQNLPPHANQPPHQSLTGHPNQLHQPGHPSHPSHPSHPTHPSHPHQAMTPGHPNQNVPVHLNQNVPNHINPNLQVGGSVQHSNSPHPQSHSSHPGAHPSQVLPSGHGGQTSQSISNLQAQPHQVLHGSGPHQGIGNIPNSPHPGPLQNHPNQPLQNVHLGQSHQNSGISGPQQQLMHMGPYSQGSPHPVPLSSSMGYGQHPMQRSLDINVSSGNQYSVGKPLSALEASSPQYRAPYPQLSPQMSPRAQMSPRPQAAQMSPRPVMSPAKPPNMSPHPHMQNTLSPRPPQTNKTSSPVPTSTFPQQTTLQALEQMVLPGSVNSGNEYPFQGLRNPMSPAIGPRMPVSPQPWQHNPMLRPGINLNGSTPEPLAQSIPNVPSHPTPPYNKPPDEVGIPETPALNVRENCDQQAPVQVSTNDVNVLKVKDESKAEMIESKVECNPDSSTPGVDNIITSTEKCKSPESTVDSADANSIKEDFFKPATENNSVPPETSNMDALSPSREKLVTPEMKEISPLEKIQEASNNRVLSPVVMMQPVQSQVISGQAQAQAMMGMPPQHMGPNAMGLGSMPMPPQAGNTVLLPGNGSMPQQMNIPSSTMSNMPLNIAPLNLPQSQVQPLLPGTNIPANSIQMPPQMQMNQSQINPNMQPGLSMHPNMQTHLGMPPNLNQMGMPPQGQYDGSNPMIGNMGLGPRGPNTPLGQIPPGVIPMMGPGMVAHPGITNLYQTPITHHQERAALQQQIQEIYCMPPSPENQDKVMHLQERLNTLQLHETNDKCTGGPQCILQNPMYGSSMIDSPQVSSTTGRGRAKGPPKPRKPRAKKGEKAAAIIMSQNPENLPVSEDCVTPGTGLKSLINMDASESNDTILDSVISSDVDSLDSKNKSKLKGIRKPREKKPKEPKLPKEPKTPKEPKIKEPKTPKTPKERKKREPKDPNAPPKRKRTKKKSVSGEVELMDQSLPSSEVQTLSSEKVSTSENSPIGDTVPEISSLETNELGVTDFDDIPVSKIPIKELLEEAAAAKKERDESVYDLDDDVYSNSASPIKKKSSNRNRHKTATSSGSVKKLSKRPSGGGRKRKRGGIVPESDGEPDDLITTPPPSPPPEGDCDSSKRRSARHTQRKKYTDDVLLRLSDDEFAIVAAASNIEKETKPKCKESSKTTPVKEVETTEPGGDVVTKPNYVYINTTDEDSMVVQFVLASRMGKRELVPEVPKPPLLEIKTEDGVIENNVSDKGVESEISGVDTLIKSEVVDESIDNKKMDTEESQISPDTEKIVIKTESGEAKEKEIKVEGIDTAVEEVKPIILDVASGECSEVEEKVNSEKHSDNLPEGPSEEKLEEVTKLELPVEVVPKFTEPKDNENSETVDNVNEKPEPVENIKEISEIVNTKENPDADVKEIVEDNNSDIKKEVVQENSEVKESITENLEPENKIVGDLEPKIKSEITEISDVAGISDKIETKDNPSTGTQVVKLEVKDSKTVTGEKLPPIMIDLEEYFVKYRNFSYLHCEWKTEDELYKGDKRIFSKIKRFKQKQAQQMNIFEYLDEEPFNPDYVEVERILDVSEHVDPATTETVKHYLVKWKSLQHEDSTWELEEDIDPIKIKQFEIFRAIPPKDKWKFKRRPSPDHWEQLKVSPIYKAGNNLRPYQLEGLNWLLFSWYNGRNCILADEMGLGKTIQSLTFIHTVWELGIRGPFLVIAPLSTIPNWQRELESWTDMNVIVYHGSQQSKSMLQEYELFFKNEKGAFIKEITKFNVLITTFEVIVTDFQDLSIFNWRLCVIDEAHRLKNRNCKLLEGLRQLHMEHRVLLSGTPLQNNVNELFSLLNFLEPSQFASSEAFLNEFGQLKTESEVVKLQALLKPMMLRRLKEDVEKSLAPKEETVVEVELTNIQKKYYRGILERNFSFLSKGTASASNLPNLMNTMMELRKCCIHPYLLNGAEEQIQYDYKQSHGEDLQAYYKALIQSSGKMVLVDKLLPKLKANGHRVLIFSQMVRCLDILEDYLMYKKYPFERIDGRIRGNLRQEAIDRFSKPDSDRFVFLLCTKAGGLGINLTAADTVIIYDSDWNPQNDLQAQARCHRIGQQKMVKIYRLLCRNTYEREMFDKASMKLGLDKAILQSMNTSQGGKEGNTKQLSKKEIEDLLKKGAYGAVMDEDNAGDKFCEEDIDIILARRTQIIQMESEKGSTFSKASFSSSGIRDDIDIDDPDFWKKWAKKAEIDTTEKKVEEILVMSEPRRRTQIKRYGHDDGALEMSEIDSTPDMSDDEVEGMKIFNIHKY